MPDDVTHEARIKLQTLINMKTKVDQLLNDCNIVRGKSAETGKEIYVEVFHHG